jgi:hypothetical protein
MIILFDLAIAIAALSVFGTFAYLLCVVFLPETGFSFVLILLITICVFVSGKCLGVIFRR